MCNLYRRNIQNVDTLAVKMQSPLGLITYEEYEPSSWITLNKDLKLLPKDVIKPASWVLILKFDIEKLYSYSITLDDIAQRIEEDAVSPSVLGSNAAISSNPRKKGPSIIAYANESKTAPNPPPPFFQ